MVEVFGKVVVEALFERVKLRARLVVVALKLRQLHQVLELFLALAVIFEAALDDKRLEVLVVASESSKVAAGAMVLCSLRYFTSS